jgi:mannose-6-phosphate isomerase-like protein (cupin superfamily)
MTSPVEELQVDTPDSAHAFDITRVRARLCAGKGGYEIVHQSRRIQISVYALVAPEPDRQRVNVDDELYIVVEGTGMLDVGGEQLELREGYAAFVPAGARHQFSAYEHLTVLEILKRGSRRMSERRPMTESAF